MLQRSAPNRTSAADDFRVGPRQLGDRIVVFGVGGVRRVQADGRVFPVGKFERSTRGTPAFARMRGRLSSRAVLSRFHQV